MRWTWLPTFMGLDTKLKQGMQDKLGPVFVGRELTDEMLELADASAVDFICERYPMVGLRDYLESLKFMEEPR